MASNGSAPATAFGKTATDFASRPVVLMVAIALTLLGILGVLVFLLWRYLRRDMTSVAVIPNAHRLHDQPTDFTRDASKLPVTLSGQEFSFSFWVYFPEVPSRSTPRVLFRRGSSDGANPMVVLDSKTNKLYVVVKTSLADDRKTYKPEDVIVDGDKNGTHMVGVIEYVPLQRWVHIAFVVQDALMTLYVDGDVYTVEHVADSTTSSQPGTKRPIVAGISGDIVVPAANDDGVRGFIARLIFMNHAISSRDVRTLYANGPRGSPALSALGLSSYGVRSPIYRIDEAQDTSDIRAA